MERENRYLVIKRADLEKYLPDMEQNQLIAIAEKVRKRRMEDGRRDDSFVCVADDWPMYETVWGMIEAWVDGGASPSMDCYSPGGFESLLRDAARYRFIRDEDNWGEDSGWDSWGALGEAHASRFDEIVDSRRSLNEKGE